MKTRFVFAPQKSTEGGIPRIQISANEVLHRDLGPHYTHSMPRNKELDTLYVDAQIDRFSFGRVLWVADIMDDKYPTLVSNLAEPVVRQVFDVMAYLATQLERDLEGLSQEEYADWARHTATFSEKVLPMTEIAALCENIPKEKWELFK